MGSLKLNKNLFLIPVQSRKKKKQNRKKENQNRKFESVGVKVKDPVKNLAKSVRKKAHLKKLKLFQSSQTSKKEKENSMKSRNSITKMLMLGRPMRPFYALFQYLKEALLFQRNFLIPRRLKNEREKIAQ